MYFSIPSVTEAKEIAKVLNEEHSFWCVETYPHHGITWSTMHQGPFTNALDATYPSQRLVCWIDGVDEGQIVETEQGEFVGTPLVGDGWRRYWWDEDLRAKEAPYATGRLCVQLNAPRGMRRHETWKGLSD